VSRTTNSFNRGLPVGEGIERGRRSERAQL